MEEFTANMDDDTSGSGSAANMDDKKSQTPFGNPPKVFADSQFHFESSSRRPYVPKTEMCISPPGSPIESYASFGDQSTTCSINARGEMMQISRYLGLNSSGIFSIDTRNAAEPYLVWSRADHLDELSRGPDSLHGFGLRVAGSSAKKYPELGFVHDRWPRIKYTTEHHEITIQMIIRNHVVIQQCTLKKRPRSDAQEDHEQEEPSHSDEEKSENDGDEDSLPKIVFDTDVLTRELDYVNGDHIFNESRSGYSNFCSLNGYGLVCAHELPRLQAGTSIQEAPSTNWICAVMSIFIDGTQQQLECGKMFEYDIPSSKDNIEFIAAYKLVCISSLCVDWMSLSISAVETDLDEFLAHTPYEPISFSKDNKMDFMIRRNLDHILSVCAIPIDVKCYQGGQRNGENNSSSRMRDDDESPIVLTCGDIAGHRICVSASYFAFRYITSIATYLKEQECDTWAAKLLYERIHKICKRHLKWVFRTCKVENGCFDSNYWVSGEIIPKTQYLPNNFPCNTPFQILKALEFFETFQEKDDRDYLRTLLGEEDDPGAWKAQQWIETLKQTDKRKSYTWRHSPEGDTGLFRLDDHILIWKALHTLEVLHESKLLKNLTKGFSSTDIRRQMITRFTTENDYLKKRIVGIARSAIQTRLMFHSRDTILLYGQEWDFFRGEDDTMLQVWLNTVESQKYQEDNQTMFWDNPLRYALAIVMAHHDYSVTLTKTIQDIADQARNALFESSFSNGLFPGQLNEATREPEIFDDEIYRDFYFHAGFEIAFILWQYQEFKPRSKTQQKKSETEPGISKSRLGSIPKRQPQERQDPTFPMSNITQKSSFEATLVSKAYDQVADGRTKEPNLAKKYSPFNNMIDSSNIVEVAEEWLYNYPTFLDFECPDFDLGKVASDLAETDCGSVIKNGAISIRDGVDSWWRRRTHVVDVPKSKRTGKRKQPDTEIWPGNAQQLWRHLREHRKAETAKKRVVWLPCATVSIALVCFIASPESEKDRISLFFDRHANYEKYFFDETAPALNTWETELHLSFYQVVDPTVILMSSEMGRIPENSNRVGHFNGKSLVKASMGFRFNGDFFDRYWTCHGIEYVAGDILVPPDVPYFLEGGQNDWKQRKVLELMLFDNIVRNIAGSTTTILNEINKKKEGLGGEASSRLLATFWTEDYFSSTSEWQDILNILRLLNDDFKVIMDTISAWESRERDRKLEKPRWTKSDERKYRRPINKLLASTKRKIRILEGHQANIQSMIQSTTYTQDFLRNELQLRSSENVRLFTYVTVVFLPLGFAASIYSMGESGPQHTVLVSMIVTAVVALAVTIIALMNVQNCVKLFWRTTRYMHKHAELKLRDSTLEWQRKKGTEHESKGQPVNHLLRATQRKKLPYMQFWIAYWLLEVPARHVAQGYRIISPKSKPSDEEKLKESNVDLHGHTRSKSPENQRLSPISEEPQSAEKRDDMEKPHMATCIYRVSLAMLFLPLYVLSYCVRLIVLNFKDVVRNVRGAKLNTPSVSWVQVDAEDLVQKLTNPDKGRLMKRCSELSD